MHYENYDHYGFVEYGLTMSPVAVELQLLELQGNPQSASYYDFAVKDLDVWFRVIHLHWSWLNKSYTKVHRTPFHGSPRTTLP